MPGKPARHADDCLAYPVTSCDAVAMANETKDVHTGSGGVFETKTVPGYVPAATANLDRSNETPDAPAEPEAESTSDDSASGSTGTRRKTAAPKADS